MAIPAKRFKFLDEETNVGFSDFLKEDNSSILNSPINELKELTATIEDFIKTSSQNFLSTEQELQDSAVDERIPKELNVGLKDNSYLKPRDVDKIISEILPHIPAAQSIFNKLPNDLKENVLSFIPGYSKPFETLTRREDDGLVTKAIGEILNKASNGSIDIPTPNKNDILSTLVMLSSLGSKINIPDTFTKLTSSIDDDTLLSRATCITISMLSDSGDVDSILSIASQNKSNITQLENPTIADTVLNSLRELKRKDNELSKTYDNINDGLTKLNNAWNTPIIRDSLSASVLLDKTGLKDVIISKVMDNVFTDLDAVPESDEVFYLLVV